jgi:hypothetical protein
VNAEQTGKIEDIQELDQPSGIFRLLGEGVLYICEWDCLWEGCDDDEGLDLSGGRETGLRNEDSTIK